MIFRNFLVLCLVLLVGGAIWYSISTLTRTDADNHIIAGIQLSERKTSVVKHIGGDYILYRVWCGSSCEGLGIQNENTGTAYQGTLSYMTDDKLDDYTIFTDWLGTDHEFFGLVHDIEAMIIADKVSISFITKSVNDNKTHSRTIEVLLD